MDIADSYAFSAPPEVVFGTLTDPARTTRWLPFGVVAEEASTERVRVRAADGVSEYQVCLQPAEMRLTWRSVGSPDLYGSARVQDGPAGGSNLQVAVSAPDGGPGPERIRAFLAETMRHLQRDVSDNFTAG